MFWGGERLKDELGDLIDGYDVKRIDRAAYRLRVGGDVYVSPTGEPNDPRNKPKKPLGVGESFTIPAGQFGFILTEELIRVPQHAIAFISIRANYKFRGLVNVSGFHVDPHYEGKLLFSVFNAGPGAVHLSRGEECFLIWYASLDRPSVLQKKMGFKEIPSDLLGPIATGVESFAGLKSKIDENDKKLNERVATVEREQAVMKWASALVIGMMITFGLEGVFSLTASGCPNCGGVERCSIAVADYYSVTGRISIASLNSSPGRYAVTEVATNNSICRSFGPVMPELRFRLLRSGLGRPRTHNRCWWAGRRAMHVPG